MLVMPGLDPGLHRNVKAGRGPGFFVVDQHRNLKVQRPLKEKVKPV